MNFDPYTQEPIHQGGIWNSGCLQHEDQTQFEIYNQLKQQGWTQDPQFHKKWQRDNRTVLVCLVDDIRSCSEDKHTDLPYLFDRNTTVITDGWIGCPTQYQVLKLPASFYGIYAADTMLSWQPDLHYTFSINRIDTRRLKLMLELAKRIHLHKGYVNFNSQFDFHGSEFQQFDLGANFDRHWDYLSDEDKEKWQASYNLLRPQIPLKNYSCEHQDIYTRSFVNIECETYSSDNSVAVSEKIFRLLTTPVPWTCYVGHYGIAYLESLGFDCMSDLADHNHYDRLKEVENKIGIFIWKSLQFVGQMRTGDQAAISQRALAAATHNQQLLAQYQQSWPKDFDQWKKTHLSTLA